ncbi:hypothetical protein Leryth_026715, partial [Lithospermum erythrorhizon]
MGSIEKAGIKATRMEYSAHLQQKSTTNLKLQQHSTSFCGQLQNTAAPRQTAGPIQIVTADGLFAGEVKQTWDRTTTTNPGKANFSERVAQKEHNEGLPLKQKTNANVGRTHQTTKKDNEYAQKKLEQIVIETFSRRASHEDSEVDENRFTQDNPQTDLPPEIVMSVFSSKGIEISMNEYQDAGYRLIARRSLSPTGRSSSKLTSLRKKVENIQICEEKTTVKDLKEYSKEYQADIERARRPKISSQVTNIPPQMDQVRVNKGETEGGIE